MVDQNFNQMIQKFAAELKSNQEKYELVKENCNGKRNFEDIFSFLWSLKDAQEILTPVLVPSVKSDSTAETLQAEVKECLQSNDLDKALELCNRSIMEASHPVMHDALICIDGGNDEAYLCPLEHPSRYGGVPVGKSSVLAKGFALRAEIMYKFSLYEKCISDIDLALIYGYPQELQLELEYRRLDCLTEREELTLPSSGEESPDLMEASPGTVAASLEETHSTTSDLCERLFSSMQITKDEIKFPVHQIFTYEVKEPPKMAEVNDRIPVLSSALDMSVLPGRGRGLIATRDIAPGEVLGIEDAYSSCIEVPKLRFHCSTCLCLTFCPLPCPGCSKVVYCNENCRLRGLTKEHWLECSILPSMIALGIADDILILKTLKTLSYTKLDDFASRLQKQLEEKQKFQQDIVRNSSSYRAVYDLCTNKEKQPFEFILLQCQIVFVITKLLLQSKKFFVNSVGEPVEAAYEDIVRTGGILLRHALQLHCNPFEIFDTQLMEPVATGLFPALSLINNSCYPNVRPYSCGRTQVIRAIRPIATGDEINISYVSEFQVDDKEKRKLTINKYLFTCTCEACEHDWPTFKDLPALKFKCLECKMPLEGRLRLCPTCFSKNANRESGSSMLSAEQQKDVDEIWKGILGTCWIDSNIRQGAHVTEENYKFISASLPLVYKHVGMPCQHVILMQKILSKCFEQGF